MKKSKPKKTKSQEIQKLKKDLWHLLSLHIREKYGYQCYTCGKHGKGGSMTHCGHFISRRKNATIYDPRNLRPQCYACNIWGYGESGRYAQRLIQDIGLEEFNRLVERSKETKQWSATELSTLINCLKSYPENYDETHEDIMNI